MIKNNNYVEVDAISLSKIKTQTYTTLGISIILENFNIKVTLKKKLQVIFSKLPIVLSFSPNHQHKSSLSCRYLGVCMGQVKWIF